MKDEQRSSMTRNRALGYLMINNSTMKILITGIHGFVGTNLVEALKKEHTIYGLDIISPVKDGVRFTFSWDYLDKPNEIPEIDAVIHLAGKAHDTKNQSAAEVYFKVNTDLTKKVFAMNI